MVASGLPRRNGHQHAGEICTMALDLMSYMRTFKIQHKPGTKLQLRVGVHSGKKDNRRNNHQFTFWSQNNEIDDKGLLFVIFNVKNSK